MVLRTWHVHHHDHLHHLVAVVAVLSTVLAAGVAQAQVSVEVAPLRVDVRMGAAGGSHTQAVTLTNRGNEPVRVHARVDDWFIARDGTPQFRLSEGSVSYSAAAWIRVNPVEQVLQPNGTGTMRFTITVPATTAPGGYHAAIMFEFSPEGTAPAARKGVMFQGRIATVVYVITGTPKPAVELTDVQPRLVAKQPPRVAVTLKNTGHVHVRTKGQMLIYDKSGAVLRRVPMPDVPILPESERDVVVDMEVDNQPPLPPGEYRVEVRVDIGLPEILVGETTVTIGS